MEEVQNLDQVAPVVSQPVVEQAPQKTLTQDEVNRIVAREKARAAESARREMEQKHQQELEALNASRVSQESRNANVSREVDANAIYQQVQEKFNAEMQERQLKAQMQQVADNYLHKVEQGRKAYEDFDEVTKDFEPAAYPQLTFLLSGMENAGDILYELSRNSTKLAALDRLAEKSPRYAQSELLKLSKSISDNNLAKKEAEGINISQPLDRLNPSRVSGSNGKMEIRDLRAQPWLRG